MTSKIPEISVICARRVGFGTHFAFSSTFSVPFIILISGPTRRPSSFNQQTTVSLKAQGLWISVPVSRSTCADLLKEYKDPESTA